VLLKPREQIAQQPPILSGNLVRIPQGVGGGEETSVDTGISFRYDESEERQGCS